MVVQLQSGTPWGADALVLLLRNASSTLDNEWVPLFKTVIEIVGSRRWQVLKDPRLEHFHNCCGADWLICGRLAIGLLDSAPQAKRIANPLQDTILPHNICENALVRIEGEPTKRGGRLRGPIRASLTSPTTV
jgi:hypothetical protein